MFSRSTNFTANTLTPGTIIGTYRQETYWRKISKIERSSQQAVVQSYTYTVPLGINHTNERLIQR